MRLVVFGLLCVLVPQVFAASNELDFSKATVDAKIGSEGTIGADGSIVPVLTGMRGTLEGGVIAGHENRYKFSPVVDASAVQAEVKPGAKKEQVKRYLEWASMLPGEHGPSQDRVLIDTTQCTIPTLNIRIRLTPKTAHIRRRPVSLAADGSGVLVFDVDMESVRDFSGSLKRQIPGTERFRWVPFSGRCERMTAVIHVAWDGDRAADPVIRQLILHEADDKRVWLQLRSVDVNDELYDVDGSALKHATLRFAETGLLSGWKTGNLYQVRPRRPSPAHVD